VVALLLVAIGVRSIRRTTSPMMPTVLGILPPDRERFSPSGGFLAAIMNQRT